MPIKETSAIYNRTRESIWTARCLGCLLCAAALAASSGCGRSGRMALEGTVTLDGQPLEMGAIRFSPLPGTTGPTAGGDIERGKFLVSDARGTFAGAFQVQITASKHTGRKVLDPRSNTLIDEYAQCLPARYNSQSELRAEVTTSGPNQFEFALVSQPDAQDRK